MRIVLVALLVAVVSPSWATEPGQPISLDDWEVLEPGYSVQMWAVRDEDCDSIYPGREPLHCRLGSQITSYDEHRTGSILDATGDHWTVTEVGSGGGCEYIGHVRTYWELRRCDPQLRCVTVARLPALRCASQTDDLAVVAMWIDNQRGQLYLRSSTWGAYPRAEETHVISGLTTTFEVLQSYTPISGVLGFRVPVMPEGLPAADYFDTYWGDLDTVGDWGLARPLQCGYPAVRPGVGDLVAIEDTLPTPVAGRGYYYVTATSYQGQRRYGRFADHGELGGRDPAVLPMCEQ